MVKITKVPKIKPVKTSAVKAPKIKLMKKIIKGKFF